MGTSDRPAAGQCEPRGAGAPRRAEGTAWRNWAGNESARPRRVAVPQSADEVADEVRKAAADGLTVRMTGTGHSFTPTAVTDGVLLRRTRSTSVTWRP